MKFMTKVMARNALNTSLSVIALTTQVNVIHAVLVNDAAAGQISGWQSSSHEKGRRLQYVREGVRHSENGVRVDPAFALSSPSAGRTLSPAGNRLASVFSPVPSLLVVDDGYEAKKRDRAKLRGHTLKRVKKKKIDLNTADEATLEKALTGISYREACAIITYRTKHGKFKTVADLVNVGVLEPDVINQHLRGWLTRVNVAK